MQKVIAVESMTCRPRFSTSKWLTWSSFTASGLLRGIGAVDAVDTRVRSLEDRFRADLGGPQRGGGVGREVRVPGPGGEDHDPALLEVADRPAADVRLGDLGHRDRGLHAGGLAERLERVLEGERIDDRGQHAHVVGAGAVHAPTRSREAPEDVPAADDDGDLDVELGARGRHLLGDALHDGGIDPGPTLGVGERLARELEHDPAESARRHATTPRPP